MVLVKQKSKSFFYMILIRKNRKSSRMIRQGYNHFDSRRNREYTSEQDIELLTYIKNSQS